MPIVDEQWKCGLSYKSNYGNIKVSMNVPLLKWSQGKQSRKRKNMKEVYWRILQFGFVSRIGPNKPQKVNMVSFVEYAIQGSLTWSKPCCLPASSLFCLTIMLLISWKGCSTSDIPQAWTLGSSPQDTQASILGKRLSKWYN